MSALVQHTSLSLVLENNPAKFLPVQCSIGLQDIVTKFLDDQLESRFPWFHDYRKGGWERREGKEEGISLTILS